MKMITMAGLALLALTGTAVAHGAAMWIQDGGYKGADGKGCCGPNDCHMEMAQDVVPTATGWLVRSTKQQFSRGDAQVFTSVDSHYWTCRRPDSIMGNKMGSHHVHCLFVPMQS